jgi:purine-nucleoside/S-methyl-5'-thioadenosine phosphorylase / adenosine deaminase
MPFAESGAWIVPAWPAPESVHAFTTTRQLPGNSQPPYDAFNLGLRNGENAPIAQANRALLERAFALPSSPRWLRQVHGNRVVRFDGDVKIDEFEADAAITSQRGVVLAILTADCMPILLCADDGSEIAAIHAGWRGLANGVIESCIEQLRTPPEKLLAWLGPAIGPTSYEVGAEVREAFLAQSTAANVAFAATRSGHWNCDLYTLARQRLVALNVKSIHGGAFDTFTDPRFYSYRRDDARSGRFATMIYMI